MNAHSHIVSKHVGRNVFDRPPRISVVIPAYNVAEFIGETLDSAIDQKFREHEIIVVNDGSPDTEALERALHTRLDEIIYIKQTNLGAGPARNTAIEHARGDLIAFLDGDDIWLPDYLASQLVFLERHGLDMVYCDAFLFGMNNAYRRTYMEQAPSNGDADFDNILDQRCNVITSGTLARKRSLIEAGLFEAERVRAHDFHLWLRVAQRGARIGYQTKPLLKYRVHTANLSGDSISRVEREIDAYKRVRNTIELTPAQHATVEKWLAKLESALAIEQGKSCLLKGEYREAALAFRVANRHRRTLKLSLAALLATFAPSVLLRFIQKHRSEDLALIRR
jgi:glycosyltransferase involved in cell wall biosynthesis